MRFDHDFLQPILFDIKQFLGKRARVAVYLCSGLLDQQHHQSLRDHAGSRWVSLIPHEKCVARMMRRRLIVLISAAAVPERRRSLYFGVRELQRLHIDVAQRVWNFATSFTLFDWLNRGDRR
jgi:hypothetical protein